MPLLCCKAFLQNGITIAIGAILPTLPTRIKPKKHTKKLKMPLPFNNKL